MSPQPQQQPGPAAVRLALKEPIRKLIEEHIEREYDEERRRLIRRAEYNLHFLRGDQFVAFAWDGERVSWQDVREKKDGKLKFCYPINIVRGDCNKYTAVVGQRAPNVKAVADDVEDQESVDAAKRADVRLRDLWVNKWRIQKRVIKPVATHQWTTGPVLARVVFNSDAFKYGTRTEPTIELVPQPVDEFGTTIDVPTETGTKEYPNGEAELKLYDTRHFFCSPHAKHLEDSDFLLIEEMVPKAKLLSIHRKQIAEKDRDDETDYSTSSASQAAQDAQESTTSPTSTRPEDRKTSWRHTEIWLRPYMFELLDGKALRQMAAQEFPDGVLVTMVNGKIVEMENERPEDSCAICKTGQGEYILGDPLVTDLIPFQKAINDAMGLLIEILLRSVPKTVVDAKTFKRSSFEGEAVVNEVLFANLQGLDPEKLMKQFPMAKLPEQAVGLIEFIRAMSREIDGILEALFGGGPAVQTWRDAKQRKDQAMMQISNSYECIQEFLERLGECGVRISAKYGIGPVKAPATDTAFGDVSDSVMMEELSEFGWHVEAEENAPNTWAEEVDRLQELIQQSPQVAQAIGVMDNVNIGAFLQKFGFRGFKVPLDDERERVEEIILELLKSPPITDVDPMTGATVEQPSIPTIDFEIDPGIVSDFVRKWLNTKRGRREEKANPQGYANVKAWGKAHQAMVPPPMPVGPDGKPLPPEESQQGAPPPPPGGEQPRESESQGDIPPVAAPPAMEMEPGEPILVQ